MAQMNPGIILAGQSPDVMGGIYRANEQAQATKDRAQQNALTGLYRQDGAAIAQGDQNALNRLAQFNPRAALQVQGDRLEMDATRQGMAIQQEEMQMVRKQAAEQAAQFAAGLSAQERAAQAAKIEAGVAAGMQAQSPEQWDRFMASQGLDQYVGQFGQRNMIAAQFMGVADSLKAFGEQKGFRPADPTEAQQYGSMAGQIDEKTGRFYPINPPSSLEMTVSPDGTVTTRQGAGGKSGLTNTGKSALDGKEISSRDTLAAVERIEQNLVENPDLLDAQSLSGQVKRMGLEWKDFITGGDLTDDQARYLVEVTTMRGDVLENVNRTIKEITGAAMGVQEAKRIIATLPNVNDSPTVFKAKLDRVMDQTRMSVARYNYWRNSGLGGKPQDAASLSEMNQIMAARAKELAQEAEASGATGEEARAIAVAAFKKEFGL